MNTNEETQEQNKMSVGGCFPELQVQQKILSEGSAVSSFCGSDVGNGDCISVPAKDMTELRNNGGDIQNHIQICIV